MTQTPPQDSVSDVERLRAAADGLLAFTTHNVACALYWDRYGSKSPFCTCGLEAARTELSAALAVPINKIGEDARTYADGVEGAAKVADRAAADIERIQHLADDSWQRGRVFMARHIATAIRRLSTSTDKGVR